MMGYGFGGYGMLFMLLFWLLVVAAAVGLLSRLFPATTDNARSQTSHSSASVSPDAVDVLKQRYARGEISRAEYDEIRRGLQA